MQVSLTFLADLPLYETEKPFYALLRPAEDFDPNDLDSNYEPPHPTNNLEYETKHNIPISNLRGIESKFYLEKHGFEVLPHTSRFANDLKTPSSIDRYKKEVQEMLKQRFDADYVFCFEARLRRNKAFKGGIYDLTDPLLVEGPALGVHTDFTVDSGPRSINHYLPDEAKKSFLSETGFRFRIMNTWRSLVAELEDNPLAVCDAQTVEVTDLIAADRIIPTRVGELYYVRYNPNQRWYWLERMSPSEPFIMAMYDSHGGEDAKFCPHISFENPKASKDAAERFSIETRAIVITKINS